MSTENIIIVGAGIAGLTCALALAANGQKVTIIEKFVKPSEIGAGIQVPPNAWRILKALGLGEKLEQTAILPQHICLADAASGRTILAIPVNQDGTGMERFGAIHRASLHAILWQEAQSQDQIEILTGHEIEEVTQTKSHVTVHALSATGPVTLSAALLIGADGIWSVTRAFVEASAKPKPTGRIALRSMGPARTAQSRAAVTAWMAAKSHIVSYPVRNADTLNLVVTTNGLSDSKDWAQNHTNALPPEIIASLRHIISGDIEDLNWTRWPLFALEPGGAWHQGRICLIGDAAHGMEPFAAQGAAMAIEDAFIIAKHIGNGLPFDPQVTFAKFRAERLPRVQKVAKRSSFNRWVYHQSGIGSLARNTFFKARSPAAFKADLDWLYTYDATAR